MTKIYLKIKSITHLFLLLAQIFTFLTLFFSVLHNFSIQGMWEIAYFMKLMLGGSLLATGLSAPTESKLHQSEEKFRTSYNRAEFYKDLFTHDINNILQSIQSALDLFAIYGKDLQDKKDFFDLIVLVHGQINRAANLVYNIKKLSEMGEKEYPLKEMDAWKCLKKSIDLIKKKYPHKKLKITLEHGAEKTLVKANELLFDVFKNILNNAIIHNKNEIIEITAKSHEIIINDSKYQKIEISDNGIGIHDAIKKKIFERATLKEKSITGTGLSLSLVKKIIESYKGEIWVENRIKEDYSKGSKVIILLPTK
ncbi:MAG: sensor histidine kinase [Promethearchaeota archaeon]